MNTMTCDDVQLQLDLLAAGECDRETQATVYQHLQTCGGCTESYAQSRQLVQQMDFHFQAAGGLKRLRQRIDQASRRKQPFTMQLSGPFVMRLYQHVAALAAMLLITLGLGLVIPVSQPEGMNRLSFEVMTAGLDRDIQAIGGNVVRGHEKVLPSSKEAVLFVKVEQTGDVARQVFLDAQKQNRLPQPPEVRVGLQLRNNGNRAIDVRFGEDSGLAFDLSRTGVLCLEAPARKGLALLRPRTDRLLPGETRSWFVERLVEVSSGRVEYVYFTEPGDYTLTVRLRVRVNGVPQSIASPEVRVRVERTRTR